MGNVYQQKFEVSYNASDQVRAKGHSVRDRPKNYRGHKYIKFKTKTSQSVLPLLYLTESLCMTVKKLTRKNLELVDAIDLTPITGWDPENENIVVEEILIKQENLVS